MGDPPGGGDLPHCSEQVPRIQGSLLQWVLAKEVHGQRDKVVQTHLLPDEKPQMIGLEVSDRQDPQSMGEGLGPWGWRPRARDPRGRRDPRLIGERDAHPRRPDDTRRSQIGSSLAMTRPSDRNTRNRSSPARTSGHASRPAPSPRRPPEHLPRPRPSAGRGCQSAHQQQQRGTGQLEQQDLQARLLPTESESKTCSAAPANP